MQSFILGEWNWPISCLKDPETQEKGLYFLGCQNLKNFQGDLGPRPPEACAFGARLGNRSVFILDPRLETVYLKVAIIVKRTL